MPDIQCPRRRRILQVEWEVERVQEQRLVAAVVVQRGQVVAEEGQVVVEAAAGAAAATELEPVVEVEEIRRLQMPVAKVLGTVRGCSPSRA